jgi:hypothetical protein
MLDCSLFSCFHRIFCLNNGFLFFYNALDDKFVRTFRRNIQPNTSYRIVLNPERPVFRVEKLVNPYEIV